MMLSIGGRNPVIRVCTRSPSKLWPRSSTPRCSSSSPLQPPDLPHLANAARISLSSQEVEKFGPKIRQVIDWFGQLQGVNLESIEPVLRAGTEVGAIPREDVPETFDNRDAMVSAIPSYEVPYIKVPKVLNKE